MLSACGSVTLTKPDDADAEAIRGVVLKAAFDELVDRGIDRFTVDRVAKRAGVEPDVIIAIWGDRRILLMDAVLSNAQEHVPVPDTGSLRGDLTAYVRAQIEYHNSEQRRALFHAFLPNHANDLDGTEVRPDFWNIRIERMSVMLERAARRGELRDGLDTSEAMKMLSAAINFDTVYTDGPVRPDYAEVVLDIFLRGVNR